MRATAHGRTVGFRSRETRAAASRMVRERRTETSKTQIKMPLTHEEIAEFIGTTRETVTRTLSQFKTHHLVALQGSTLSISNRPALETISRSLETGGCPVCSEGEGGSMKVKEIMTQSAVCCGPDTNVGAAVELLWVHNCGMLPVVGAPETRSES